MSHSQGRLSLKRALGFSAVLHLILGALFLSGDLLAVHGAEYAAGRDAAETTHISYLTFDRRPKTQPKPVVERAVAVRTEAAPRANRASAPARQPLPIPERAVSGKPAARAKDARFMPALTTGSQDERSPQTVVARAVAPPVVTSATAHETPEAMHAAAVAAAPAAAPPVQAAEASVHGIELPPGGWGQIDKPLIADEAALADIRSRYHAGSAVTIEVDEAGHAIRISLPDDLTGDARLELEKRLRELRYVPAECNGLRCGGTLQISI